MAKKVTKSLKMRRRIRKTLGTICLITAIIVAAIPVPESAAGLTTEVEGTKYTWDKDIWKGSADKSTSVIPVIKKECKEIYTTGDGTFQFAFVNESPTSNNKIAVILGYNSRNLVNNYLEIPDEVNAYTKYNENEGTFTGYVAVSKSQKPLFYKKVTTTEVPIISGGDSIGVDIVETSEYLPCYYSDRNSWSQKELTDFYYYDGTDYKQTTDEKDQWIKALKVYYIGNQSLVSVTDTQVGASQGWAIAEDSGKLNVEKSKGVFANNSNIVKLVVGEELKGIGNYAFYGCTNLETITLGNNLSEIGKYAFADCINMKTIGVDFTSNIQYISDYAFQNCRALESFVLPSGVQYIYDHAFDGCQSLSNVDIAGIKAQKNVNLKDLGYYVFSGCSSLQEITIPTSLEGTTSEKYGLPLNNFKNCSNLRRIIVQSALTNPIVYEESNTNDNYTMDEFRSDVHSTFYFECIDNSKTHEFTEKNAIAFKYADADKYEIIIISSEGEYLTYQVNSKNQLLYFHMTGAVAEVTIPANVGPYGISEINAGSFSGNCFLKKITIPATVTAINENAFKGCHNLKHVIYANAANITYIGNNAFATQVVDLHAEKCTDRTLPTTPTLTFTGDVGSGIVPYTYAMSATSNINAGTQTLSYITYYSGWPTNLEIRYNSEKGKAELADYPSFQQLKKVKYNKADYPYMTEELENSAKAALDQYTKWLTSPTTTEVTQYQWQILNAALSVTIPEGVTSIKTGLFSGVTGTKDAQGVMSVPTQVGTLTPDKDIKAIKIASVDSFEPYSFSGCEKLNSITITGGATDVADYAFAYAYTLPDSESGSESVLETFSMTGGGKTIGNYAFCNNAKLTNVTISPAVETLGLRPFKDCTALKDVSFGGGPNFTCASSIIYGTTNGSKTSIVQCLESRNKTVNATELAGVQTLADEAFKDCTGIGSVDLSTTSIARVPKSAFENTTGLFSAVLPSTCKSIGSYAFQNSGIQYVVIPSSVTYIEPSAFNNEKNLNSSNTYKEIEFYAEAGSAAETYANEYDSITVTDKPIEKYFTVTFWDYTGTDDALAIVETQTVAWGANAVPPTHIERDGYTFSGWLPEYTDVSRDMDVIAQYKKTDEIVIKYTVRFLDYDDKVLYTQEVLPGADCITPAQPTRDGYTFKGWRPAITNITKDTDTYAQYDKNETDNGNTYTVRFFNYDDTLLYTQTISHGGNAISPQAPTRTGYTFTGWKPVITNITKDTDTYAQFEKGTSSDGTDGTGTNSKLYTLTVKNGSGSGSYAAGASVIIIANDPAASQKFSKWTTDETTLKLASTAVAATVLTMPEKDATVTANFEKSTDSSNNNSSNNNSGNTTSGGNSSNTNKKPGNTIFIEKNGLSNTGVVSATVNGSSDNFVIKITEDSEATEAAIRALMNEYGSLENIKYFPMDITLYDSTGKTKITDTTGLSITITLPLPDSLITYAGNNKIASVVNDQLDKLTPKFTTIDGVSCITFTAEHFSPYVIYVNTTNLSSTGSVADDSPKTGDIHPKWFLVIGLGCISVILFAKKDKKGRVSVA